MAAVVRRAPSVAGHTGEARCQRSPGHASFQPPRHRGGSGDELNLLPSSGSSEARWDQKGTWPLTESRHQARSATTVGSQGMTSLASAARCSQSI